MPAREKTVWGDCRIGAEEKGRGFFGVAMPWAPNHKPLLFKSLIVRLQIPLITYEIQAPLIKRVFVRCIRVQDCLTQRRVEDDIIKEFLEFVFQIIASS